MYHARSVSPLMPGESVGLFSPSEPLTDERIVRMQDSLKILQSNYNIIWGNNALKNNYYQAGSRTERLNDIIELISNSNIKAMLATWGGKNGNQLLRYLPYEQFSERRIPIIGFSDTCVLLNPISVYSDIITFYGPNIAGKLTESSHADMSDLRQKFYAPFGETASQNWTTITSGQIDGVLYGGNLSTFTIALSGTECLRKMKDVIFFWESAGDPPQIIDQYLSGLENAGFLDRLKGMIVGKVLFEETERKNRPLNDLLYEYGSKLNIPIIKIDTFGHCKTENPMIPIGARVSINTYTHTINLTHPVVI